MMDRTSKMEELCGELTRIEIRSDVKPLKWSLIDLSERKEWSQ
jgi:hypothetical protein